MVTGSSLTKTDAIRLNVVLQMLLLWILSTFTLVSSSTSLERPQYRTVYACEGATLLMQCEQDHVINLIRANYGRFSITICNEHGNTEWSVNCMSLRSHRVLHDRCSQRQNCTIAASTRGFGDPCPGTLKYLEAHFQCIPVNPMSNTARPRPPWFLATKTTISSITENNSVDNHNDNNHDDINFPLISNTTTGEFGSGKTNGSVIPTLRPPPWLVTNFTNATTTAPPSTTSSSTTTEMSTVAAVTTAALLPADVPSNDAVTESMDDFYPDVEANQGRDAHAAPFIPSSERPQSRQSWCNPSAGRGLNWNWTAGGEIAVQACPGGASGWATRSCGQKGWSYRPNLSECRSVWLTTLQSRAEANDAVLSVAHDLTLVTQSRPLYGGDMTAAARLINGLVERMSNDVSGFPDELQRAALITELLIKTLTTTSNLLGRQRDAWADLETAEHHTAVTELLLGLEEAAFLLANNIYHEKTISHVTEKIMMQIKVIETHNVIPIVFPLIRGTNHNAIDHIRSSEYESVYADRNFSATFHNFVNMPPEAMLENSDNGLVKIVFFAYDGLQHLLQPERIYERNFMDYNQSRIVNSLIVSASLGAGRHIELSEPVIISFEMIRKSNVTNPICVFWDFTTSVWSDEGCSVLNYNGSHTICKCNHLTNFAVIVDLMRPEYGTSQALAYTVVAFVGCIISVVCLLLATIFFHAVQELKGDRTSIHKNVCACLMLGEALFMVAVLRIEQPVISSIVSGFLHYIFLAAFAWIFLEGFQLYVMLIEVFEIEKTRIHWYYATAYGIPALIVAVSAIIDPYSYSVPYIGWLKMDNYFAFSMIGPALLALLANCVLLTLSLLWMYRYSRNSAALKNKDHMRLNSLKSWTHGAIVQMVLVALTWSFAVLYLNQITLTMAYLFTVFNSLQGLFIFGFHCLQNDKRCLCQSSDKDGDNFDSDQAESSRGTTKLPSLRLNCNSSTLQQSTDVPRFINSLPPPGESVKRRIAAEIRGSNNNPPWTHTYSEIPDRGILIADRGILIPDPVYEEIDKERRSEILSDLSDDDGRKQSSDVSRQSSRNYGDHRPLLPYTLADNGPPGFQRGFHHAGSLHRGFAPAVNHSASNSSPLSNTCLGIVDASCYYPKRFNSLSQHSSPLDHNMHLELQSSVPQRIDPNRLDVQQNGPNRLETSGPHRIELHPNGPHRLDLQPSGPHRIDQQTNGPYRLDLQSNCQQRADLQQLQNMGEMTVAVLNGEQVVCKLKSPLAPIHENSAPILQPIEDISPSKDRYLVHSYQRC